MRALGWLALALAFAACAHSPAPPLPEPVPGALWPAQTFNCRTGTTAAERETAAQPVRACMLGAAPDWCLDVLVSQHTPTTLACEVRRFGVISNAAVLAGSADPADQRLADVARKLETDGVWGYR